MDIIDTALYRTIQRVQANPTNSSFTWDATIHAGGQNIKAIKVLNHDQDQDYFGNVADVIMISLTLRPSEFFKYIYPNQENMEITVIKTPLGENGQTDGSSNQNYQSERYVATYIDNGNPLVEGTNSNNSDSTAMDLGDFLTVDFQLINVAVARMRLLPVGTIYRQMTPGDALRSCLDYYSKQVQVEKLRIPQGTSMATPNNKTVREQMVVPQGTMLIDVPKHFQEKFGIYSSGFSYYYWKDRWHVWPCYDVERKESNSLRGTIISIPTNRMPDFNRTFMVSGSLLTILATGDKSFRDDSNQLRANQGDGVRFADANNIMSNMAQVKDNKAYISRGANNTEVIASRNPKGYDNVMMSPTRITANPYMEYSRMAGREGSVMSFVWQHADPTYLYPGMPFEYYYMENDAIKKLKGILMHAISSTRLDGVGVTANRYRTDTVVTLFVKRELET